MASEKPTLEDVLARVNESISDFLDHPAVNANDQGSSGDCPLHKVAIWGDIAAADVLLRSGADVNAVGEDGDTPLHRAIAGRHVEMARFLVSRGASLSTRNRYGSATADDARVAFGEDWLSR